MKKRYKSVTEMILKDKCYDLRFKLRWLWCKLIKKLTKEGKYKRKCLNCKGKGYIIFNNRETYLLYRRYKGSCQPYTGKKTKRTIREICGLGEK